MSTARKLTRAERRQIEAAIARAKKQDKNKKSAQDSIPMQRMYPDGICRVVDNYYTKTIQFQDINYQLCQNEDQQAIFGGWCSFLNYFDATVRFQFSFVNLSATKETFAGSIVIPRCGNDDDSIREEYESLTDGIINKDEYMRLKQRYSEQNTEAEKQLLALQDVLADIQEHGSASLGWMNEFREHQNITALDRETVVALIERIFVFDDKRVEITFRWHDEYEWQADILQRAQMKEAV